MKLRHVLVSASVAMIIAGCSSTPKQYDELESARSAVQRVESSPDAGRFAATEVTAAHDALREAEAAAEKGRSAKLVKQKAYLAQRHAETAAAQIARGEAERKTQEAEAERQRVVLQAREQEAAAARAQAERDRLAAEQRAEQARVQALESSRQAAQLADQLRDLQARQTERGLVLTLGDVLFDTGKATLKPGAMSTMDRLARFLTESPDRSVTIEGHTDSVGEEDYNQMLSESRASAVKAALVTRQVDAGRVLAVGKGESAPVAGNDTAAGRQQNRRVEIIVSNPTAQAAR